MSDLCTGAAAPDATRERLLAWLGEGAREVRWALCSVPRERWTTLPPAGLHPWPVLRHARHLALRELYWTLPTVRVALGGDADTRPSIAELEQADAAWNASAARESAEAIVDGLGSARFELLQRLEAAPDEAWTRRLRVPGVPDTAGFSAPVQLNWLMLDARQHELEHLAAIWRVALYWDHAASAPAPGGVGAAQAGLPLHPADRLEESH